MKKWMPAGLGADPKKLVILGVLVIAIVIAYKMSSGSSAPEQTSTPSPAPVSPAISRDATPIPGTNPVQPRRAARNGEVESVIGDFHPSLKVPEGTDVASIDPTLKLDLLAKVQHVPMEGGSRSLFEFAQPPPPPPPKVTIKPGPVAEAKPEPKPAAPTGPPPAPPPPPIPLKFYGYAGTTRDGVRRAFFLDGDDIFTPAENELVKGRYKIIRIGVNSAVVEDETNKNQQTLPLVEELGA
ncbi:MAG: hypothetical protein JO307_08535 [Bryobacterales bacterium]|nr:hypothetical protein [Bryobacterales bacterium]MBV9398482.1 hypothetical protein [Bryobacterales bacterium]